MSITHWKLEGPDTSSVYEGKFCENDVKERRDLMIEIETYCFSEFCRSMEWRKRVVIIVLKPKKWFWFISRVRVTSSERDNCGWWMVKKKIAGTQHSGWGEEQIDSFNKGRRHYQFINLAWTHFIILKLNVI